MRNRVRCLAGLLTFITLVAAAPPTARADDTTAIAFADPAPLSLSTDVTQAILIVNQAADEARVSVVFAPDPTAASARFTVPEGELTIKPFGTATVFGRSGDTPGGGYLIVTDGRSSIRRTVTVAAPLAKPAVTAWTSTVRTQPWTRATDVRSLPLATAVHCGTDTAPPATVLDNGRDEATLTASCSGDAKAFTLELTNLDRFEAGTYKGTLKVGDADVEVEITRTSAPWLPLVALLLGLVAAVVVRTYQGRRPLQEATKQAAALSLDAPAGLAPTWNSYASAAVEATKLDLTKRLGTGIWATWQARPLRIFFVPSAVATTKIATVATDTTSAAATLKRWSAGATDAWQDLDEVANAEGRPALGALQRRAGALRDDPAKAGPAAAAVPDRTGVAGLAALLDETTAIVAVQKIADNVAGLQARIEDIAQPPVDDPTAEDRHYLALWRHVRASAVLATDGLTEELRRTTDAVAALDGGLVERGVLAERLVDQLGSTEFAGRADAVPEAAGTELEHGAVEGLMVGRIATPIWSPWPTLKRAIERASASVVLNDLTGLVVAMIIVLWSGLTLIYVGKAWGTPFDIATAFLAGLTGTLVIQPVLAAIDRLGGTTDKADA